MKTICIENKPCSSIGGGIHFSHDNILYTTNQENIIGGLRGHNCRRFHKEVIPLTQNELINILKEQNNIQIINNNGNNNIPGFYKAPDTHPILSKNNIIALLRQHQLDHLLPKTVIVPIIKDHKNINNIINQNFTNKEKIVLKHSDIDGNGNGVYIIHNDSKITTTDQIINALNKYDTHYKSINQIHNLLQDSLIIQEYIEEQKVEGSITFSIQNKKIENWGLVKNITRNGEYFLSTNYFNEISDIEKTNIEIQLYESLLPLLNNLQQEGIRGNVCFDLLIDKKNKIFILECNGIHRTTGSSLPNSFAYNTNNEIFIGIPLSQNKLKTKYNQENKQQLLKLADHLKDHGTTEGENQIINLKTEGFEWNYPVSRIALAGNNIRQLISLFQQANITSKKGKEYSEELFTHII